MGIRKIIKNRIYENNIRSKYKDYIVEEKLNIDWNSISCNRIALINAAISKVIKLKNECKYLEIGCDQNETYDSIALCSEDKTGVDPASGGNARMTSDKFFETNRKNYDVVFIDGLHEYKQCQKDIINALACLNEGGFILIHDMIPLNWRAEFVPRFQDTWNGDVWKTAYELSKSNNLEFSIIEADNGVGIIKNVSKNYDYNDLSSEIEKFKFKEFLEIYKFLPILKPDNGFNYILS